MIKQIKKILIRIFCIGLFFAFSSINLFPQAWLVGGNPVAIPNQKFILGTLKNYSVTVITDSIPRLYINKDTGIFNGFVGIGTNFTQPQSLLHLNDSTNSQVFTQWTNKTTGATRTDGFKAGIEKDGTAIFDQRERKKIFFNIKDVQTIYQHTKFTIRDTTQHNNQTINPHNSYPLYTDVPRVGIWRGYDATAPYAEGAMLHIGDAFKGNDLNWAGHRDWMNVGTFCYGNTDNMYIGLREFKSDSSAAIINWGNNPSGEHGPLGNIGDKLMFIFTAATNNNNGIAAGYNGIEVARMWSNGNQVRTRFGYDAGLTSFDPKNTVHIIGAVEMDTMQGGNSGLRFQNLTSNTVPREHPFTTNVLSITNKGDVILIPGKHGPNSANNGTSISDTNVVFGNNVGGTSAQLISDREIPMGNHDILFTDPNSSPDRTKNRIGIGMWSPDSLSPNIRLEVRGSVSIYDGYPGLDNNGDNSLFFGREQSTLRGKPAHNLGEWGIQYLAKGVDGIPTGGINFWKPWSSDGNWGNYFLWLSDSGHIGINTVNPANRMEISAGVNSSVLNPISAITRTRSGLRFTNLNATMQPDGATNSSNTVLSVNNTGDVILVNGGSGLGGECGTSPQPLANSWEIPLGGNHFIFSGQGYDATNNVPTSSVGIGIDNSTCLPVAKLDILENAGTVSSSIGLNVRNEDVLSGEATIFGIVGTVNGDVTQGIRRCDVTFGLPSTHKAGVFNASNACVDYGIDASASGSHEANYGIKASAFDDNMVNYGVNVITYGVGSSNQGVTISSSGDYSTNDGMTIEATGNYGITCGIGILSNRHG